MDEGELKERLQQCAAGPFEKHRLLDRPPRRRRCSSPSTPKESYEAAARMGAGILECDVTFTKDRQLVCRHSQCDLHTTTNILAIPELAAKCTEPFTAGRSARAPARRRSAARATSRSPSSSARGKMDAFDPDATTVADYMGGTAGWRTDLYSTAARC